MGSAFPGRVPRVSINVSAHQLADPRFAWTLQAAMAHAGASPSWVTLELTESLLMHNSAAALEQLHAIRGLGVHVAIDDFGTGYSSLAYLERFPVTHIKIDRSFVTPLDDPRQGAGVVRAIVEIGRALGLTTVAEGIETPAELRRLQELGCVLGQGFLFSRPLEPDAMADLVARKAGPVFARQVAAADPGRSVGRRRPPPPGGAGRRPMPSVASMVSRRALRTTRLKRPRTAGSSSMRRTGPRAASDDGLGSVISPATRSMWG